MSIRLQLPKITELKPRITVIGVGGAGGNAINNMIASGLVGVVFIAANTDAQALSQSSAEHRIQLGINLTEGLGAGSKPEVGEAAAEEAVEEIRSQIQGSHMVFVAAGMGGGTGTGAAAVIARAARELGILVVGVVTKPFQFEGARRMRMAEAGIAELKQQVDTLIVIPNQNLFRLANEKTTFADAFVLADQVLYSGIACIVDLIVKDGLINLDFADVRTVMKNMGAAMMGTGEGSGERRAIQAAEEAITNPLLDNVSLKGARGLLLSIIGGRDMTLYEVDEAASRVRQEVDPEANIIVGASFDETLGDRVRVSIVASGMEKNDAPAAQQQLGPQPVWPRPAVPAATGPAAQPILSKPSHAVGPGPARELQQQVAQAMIPHGPMPTNHLGRREKESALNLGPAKEVPAPQKVETWQAPGNVVIEARLPQLAPPQEPRRDLGGGGQYEPYSPGNGAPQHRRMPEVSDFPQIAQREYHAKAGSHPGQTPPAGYAPEPRSQPLPPPVAEPPKRGLLARLTGRRAESIPANPGKSTDSQPQSQRPVHSRPPESQLTWTNNANPHGGNSAPRPTPLTPLTPDKHQEDIDLPMFFHREGKS